jgi:uncharacterized membrane protein YgcG
MQQRLVQQRLVWTFQLFLALAICSVMGCGGGGSSTTRLTGDAAHRAAVIAGYQSFSAGVAYPFNTLKMIAPTGSAIRAGKSTALTAALRPWGLAPLSRHSGTTRATNLPYISGLNLYSDETPVVNGNTWTLNFFTDAAGTASAGNIVITLPANANGGTDYPSYPAQITMVINLTAGNLPCNGNVVVTFTGNTGKNTMTGKLTLARGPITFNIDLALDDSLNVTGTIVGQENGTTISLTNCTGNLFGTLSCDLSIQPYGWTGTATGSFVTGQFSTKVTTTTGNCTASIDSSGNLVIAYPDGKTETVTNPLAAALTTSSSGSSSSSTGTSGTGTSGTGSSGSGTSGTGSSGSGGTTGTTTPTYNAPLNLGAITPVQINTNGQILGISADSSKLPVFMQSSTATLQSLPGVTQPFQSGGFSALRMNNSGQIVGFGGNVGGAFWQSATSQPQLLSNGNSTAYAISDGGVIVGQTFDALSTPITTAWNDPKTPHTMTSLGIYDTPLGISSDGQIVGWTYSSNAITLSYWKSSSAAPTALATGALLSNPGTTSMSINASGQICATLGTSGNSNGGVYWASPTSAGQYLPGFDVPVTGSLASILDAAFSINASGVIVGSCFSSSFFPLNYHAVVWKNLKVQDLNTLIPTGTGWVLTSANAINDQGTIVGVGQLTVNGKQQTAAFLLTPK